MDKTERKKTARNIRDDAIEEKAFELF